MKQNPCFNCENRKMGCHSNCELYLDWNDKHTEEAKRINKKRAESADYRRYKMEVCRRSKRND